MKRIALIVAVLALVASACGGGSKKDASVKAKDAASSGENAQGGASTTTPKHGVDKSKPYDPRTNPTLPEGAKPGFSTSTTAAGDPGTTTTTKPHVPVTAKLDKTCVRRGAIGDLQGLTVHTDPGDTVGYSTEYSNHHNEMSDPKWKTGFGYGKADLNGNYYATWKLPEDVPLGTATLRYIAEGKIQTVLTFEVVDQNGHC